MIFHPIEIPSLLLLGVGVCSIVLSRLARRKGFGLRLVWPRTLLLAGFAACLVMLYTFLRWSGVALGGCIGAEVLLIASLRLNRFGNLVRHAAHVKMVGCPVLRVGTASFFAVLYHFFGGTGPFGGLGALCIGVFLVSCHHWWSKRGEDHRH